VSVLVLSGCRKGSKGPEELSTNEPCEWPVVLEVVNVKGEVIMDRLGVPSYEITGFDLTLPVALDHLYVCNLADSLKIDGLKISFSGKIRYQDYIRRTSGDIGSLPVTLTSVEF
jgi:hypothetical protein